MKATNADVVTKSELAGELRCSKSTITAMCSKGLPVRADGRLNRTEALQWIASRTDGFGGGWWGTLRSRASLQDRAVAVLKGEAIPVPVDSVPTPAERQSFARALNIISSPEEVLSFCRVALRAGVSAQQAYVIGLWFTMAPVLALPLGSKELAGFQPVSRRDWRTLLGGAFDFEKADELYAIATADEIRLEDRERA